MYIYIEVVIGRHTEDEKKITAKRMKKFFVALLWNLFFLDRKKRVHE